MDDMTEQEARQAVELLRGYTAPVAHDLLDLIGDTFIKAATDDLEFHRVAWEAIDLMGMRRTGPKAVGE